MKKLNARETLLAITELLLYYAEELRDATPQSGFAYGAKTAYVECLEMIQLWDSAHKFGLDFEIESKYPL